MTRECPLCHGTGQVHDSEPLLDEPTPAPSTTQPHTEAGTTRIQET